MLAGVSTSLASKRRNGKIEHRKLAHESCPETGFDSPKRSSGQLASSFRRGISNNWALNSNELGQVVGFSDVAGDTTNYAFLWQGGVMTPLGTLDFSSFAAAINNTGQVVGASCDQNGNCRAFLWQNGKMTDLNTLIPADSPLYLLQALDINSFGQIVGCAFQFGSGEVHAFLLTPVSRGGSAGPTLAALDEGVKISLSDDVRRRLHDSVIRSQGRFKFRIAPAN